MCLQPFVRIREIMSYLGLLHSPELHSERISTVTPLRNQRFGPTKYLKVWDPHLNLHSTNYHSSAHHKLSVPLYLCTLNTI